MTVYFAGLEDIEFNNQTGLSVSTDSTLRVTGRCSLYATATTDYLIPNHADFTLNDLWLRIDIAVKTGVAGSEGKYGVRFMRGVSKDTFACGIKAETVQPSVLSMSPMTYKFVVDTGSGTLVESAPFSLPKAAGSYVIRVRIVGTSLKMFLFNSNSQDLLAYFSTTLVSTYSLTGLQFGTGGTGASWVISAIAVADEPVFGWTINRGSPATGPDNGWSGAWSNITETVLSFSNVISTDTVNDRASFVTGAISVPSGHDIKGLGLTFAARRNAGTLSVLKSFLRKSSVYYDLGTVTLTTAQMYRYWTEVDPATGVKYTNSDAASASIIAPGFVAIS